MSSPEERFANLKACRTAAMQRFASAFGDESESVRRVCRSNFFDGLIFPFFSCFDEGMIKPTNAECGRAFKMNRANIGRVLDKIEELKNLVFVDREGEILIPEIYFRSWLSLYFSTRAATPSANVAILGAFVKIYEYVANRADRKARISQTELVALFETSACLGRQVNLVENRSYKTQAETVELVNLTIEWLNLPKQNYDQKQIDEIVYSSFDNWLLTLAGIPENEQWLIPVDYR